MQSSVNKKRYILVFAIVGVLSLGFIKTDLFEVSKNLDIFNNLYRVLNESYVDETKPGQLMKTAIDGMLESLDPYTNYITENDLEDFMIMTTGEYGGVGARVGDVDGKIMIYDIYEGFSAQRNGVIAGDEIVEINGQNVKGKKSDDVSPLLKGQAGSPLKIKVIHPGQTSPVEINLMREEIKLKPVPYSGMIDNKTGYIKLIQFTENCSVMVKDALTKLKERNCKSLILDMRGNPGGLMLEAVNIVNLFVDKGREVVSTKGKVSDWDKTYISVNPPVDTIMPLVVLIDENSASAAEIVAGALQDLDRAAIVGQRSFGKGLVQQTRDLTYNAKLKVTVAKYYIPSGRCIQALDYTHKDEDGRVEKVPDSLITAFKTKGGRIVYDGAGIMPDVIMEQQKLNHITLTLINKNHFFNYATQYVLNHGKINSVKDFQLSDQEYASFVDYLKDKDVSYKTDSERALEELKKQSEEESYYQNIKSDYDALVAKMQADKKDDLSKFKSEIKQYLEEEIISRYFYMNGRIEHNMKTDIELKAAQELLSNEGKYKGILTLKEKATRPFNPRKKF
ncbi:MAG: S41 family peptidase [Bacteroidetes bacterium]|nr:S41 family peptidase [Bacteroidota bacterium]